MRLEHWLYTIPLRLRSLFRRNRVEQELKEELQYHLERKTEEFLAQGMTRQDARRGAIRAMDGLELRKEQCRDARDVSFIETLLQDVRFGLRMLRKSPGFTTVAVLTLALGIGVNTAIFSVVNAVLLSPLPYSYPDRLMLVKEVLPNFSATPVEVSAPDIPRDFKLGVVAQPLVEQVVGPARPMLVLLLGAVGFVLLIACANIANLVLVRASGRRKELAVRLAIGAGRRRLLHQLLVEGLLLSFAGGGLGLILSVWFKNALAAGLPASVPKAHPVELDVPVLLFTMGLALTTGLVFGVLPALSATRTDPRDALKEGGRGSEGAGHQRLRGILVATEVALSMVLLVGAGLLLRSFERVLETKAGFEPTRVLTAQINAPEAQYPKEEMVYTFYRGLLERLRQTPGVKAAGTSTDMPLLGQWDHVFTPEGYTPPPGTKYNMCYHSVISGDYLQAMGIPLLRGRYFDERDGKESTHVLIVSDGLAKRFWPNQDPIGKRLKWGPPESHDPWLTVVGVVGDVKQGPLEEATVPHTYEYYAQLGAIQNLVIALRSEDNPQSLAAGVRAAVWVLDRQIAVDKIRTMDQVIGKSTAARRFNLFLIGAFAALALLLAAIGIYGVLAFSVSKRAHEIGIRMALGARSSEVARMVIGQAMRVVGIGVFVGALGALLLGRFLQRMLYEIRAIDPLTFVGVVVVLGAAAWAASYLPARRAMRVDPMVALRYE